MAEFDPISYSKANKVAAQMAEITNIIDTLENSGIDVKAREDITKINELLGDDELETEAQTVTGAINVLKDDLDTHKADNVTDDGGVHGLEIEEGSFTPYITGSTDMGTFAPTYTEQSGWYVKINNLVKFGLRLIVSSFTGDVSGTFRIGGLPFVPNVRVGLLVSHVANMTSDPSVLSAVTLQGQPLIGLGKLVVNQGVGAFLVTDMGTNFDISITGEYRTAA